jgi:hypothetical protein
MQLVLHCTIFHTSGCSGCDCLWGNSNTIIAVASTNILQVVILYQMIVSESVGPFKTCWVENWFLCAYLAGEKKVYFFLPLVHFCHCRENNPFLNNFKCPCFCFLIGPESEESHLLFFLSLRLCHGLPSLFFPVAPTSASVY